MSSIRQAILRIASLLLPSAFRVDWLAEWEAELWHIEHKSNLTNRQIHAFCLGAFKDSLWLRLNESNCFNRGWLTSPSSCISLLVLLSAFNVTMLLQHPLPPEALLFGPRNILLVLAALAIVPSTISLDLSEYPQATSRARMRRWIFFAIKTGLLVLIVYCVTLGSTPIGIGPLQIYGALIGYILAFRWSLIDQRKRCPICLRRLASPIRIGEASNTFLGWYGTELICGSGHGTLHVSEIQTSSYSARRWLNL